jgi:hypothetical protein
VGDRQLVVPDDPKYAEGHKGDQDGDVAVGGFHNGETEDRADEPKVDGQRGLPHLHTGEDLVTDCLVMRDQQGV